MKLSAEQKSKLANLTEFQRSVLFACMKIKKGKTVSYSKIAKMIGKPKAVRAVGNALSKNPLAPLIPCHRVIRKDGSLGGYSAKGGRKKKQILLKNETKKK
ncbi:MGMT family protein [Candidatus Micrarchaeota archaeon]|nr:MGMT family protein [Candidatus Micrarchaeota archaeon]